MHGETVKFITPFCKVRLSLHGFLRNSYLLNIVGSDLQY